MRWWGRKDNREVKILSQEAVDKLMNVGRSDIQEDKPSLNEMELRAALGTMLSTWDRATEKLNVFIRENNKENAEAYMKEVPAMFDAAIVARSIYERTKPYETKS